MGEQFSSSEQSVSQTDEISFWVIQKDV